MTKKTWSDGNNVTATELNRMEDQLTIICTSGTRPTGVDGQHIYETDTNRKYHYNGSSWINRTDDGWTSFTPTLSGFTLGDGTHDWDYRYVNGLLHVKGVTTLGSTSSVSGNLVLTLPNSATLVADTDSAVRGSVTFNDGGTLYLGEPTESSSTTVSMFAVKTNLGTGSVYAALQACSSTIPFSWASGDEIRCNIVCAVT